MCGSKLQTISSSKKMSYVLRLCRKRKCQGGRGVFSAYIVRREEWGGRREAFFPIGVHIAIYILHRLGLTRERLVVHSKCFTRINPKKSLLPPFWQWPLISIPEIKDVLKSFPASTRLTNPATSHMCPLPKCMSMILWSNPLSLGCRPRLTHSRWQANKADREEERE